MAGQINCNEIQQVALELQMKFQNCTTLNANDLDCLIDLIMAIGDCITEGNYNQNNIINTITIDGDFNLPIEDKVNNLPLFTINEDEVFLFSTQEYFNDTLDIVNKIYIQKPGKGVYGNSATYVLESEDFICIESDEYIHLLNNALDTLIIPDSLNINDSTLELIANNDVISAVDLCPAIIHCIMNNPQIICNIMDTVCAEPINPIITDVTYTNGNCCNNTVEPCVISNQTLYNDPQDIFYLRRYTDNYNPYSISSRGGSSNSINFSTDGLKVFYTDTDFYHGGTPVDRIIIQAVLTIPFDITTIDLSTLISFSLQGGTQLTMSEDGSKIYINEYINYSTGYTNSEIKQYTLTTPFDLSTITFSGNAYDCSHLDKFTDMSISSNGSYMFVRVGTGTPGDPGATSYIQRLELSTPFDISTASYSGNELQSPNGVIPINYACKINFDGTSLYWGGRDYITKYNLAVPYDLNSIVSQEDLLVTSPDTYSPQNQSIRGIYINEQNQEVILIVNDQDDHIFKYKWQC